MIEWLFDTFEHTLEFYPYISGIIVAIGTIMAVVYPYEPFKGDQAASLWSVVFIVAVFWPLIPIVIVFALFLFVFITIPSKILSILRRYYHGRPKHR